MDDAVKEVLDRTPVLPVPREYDALPECVFALHGGGYECYECMVRTPRGEPIRHEPGCPATEGEWRSHGEARAEYEKARADRESRADR